MQLSLAFADDARDAVRVPRYTGLATLARLAAPGPVLVHPTERTLYFFVPAGSVPDLILPEVCVRSTAADMLLPPADRITPPGPYWLTETAERRLFVQADDLLAAIAAALNPDARCSR